MSSELQERTLRLRSTVSKPLLLLLFLFTVYFRSCLQRLGVVYDLISFLFSARFCLQLGVVVSMVVVVVVIVSSYYPCLRFTFVLVYSD